MLKALGHRVQRIYERKSGVLSKRSRKKSSRGYCWRGIFPGKVNSLAKGGAGFEKPAQQIELVNRGQLLSPTWRVGRLEWETLTASAIDLSLDPEDSRPELGRPGTSSLPASEPASKHSRQH